MGTFQGDEDRKNHERMQALIDQLQGKIKSYKKQIEEAEEIAALNLAKFRTAQNTLADSAERADIDEQVLAKAKAKGRGSVGPLKNGRMLKPSTFPNCHDISPLWIVTRATTYSPCGQSPSHRSHEAFTGQDDPNPASRLDKTR